MRDETLDGGPLFDIVDDIDANDVEIGTGHVLVDEETHYSDRGQWKTGCWVEYECVQGKGRKYWEMVSVTKMTPHEAEWYFSEAA